MDWSPPGSSVHGHSPDKNTRVGCLALLQGIFPNQGLNWGLPHCRWILYHLSTKEAPEYWLGSFSRGSSQPRNWPRVSCIAGRFFASWAAREMPLINYLELREMKLYSVFLSSSSSLLLCILPHRGRYWEDTHILLIHTIPVHCVDQGCQETNTPRNPETISNVYWSIFPKYSSPLSIKWDDFAACPNLSEFHSRTECQVPTV